MPNDNKPNPKTGQESDISKSQSQQQPNQQPAQKTEGGEQRGQFGTSQREGSEPSGDQAATGQPQTGAGPDEGLQGETSTQKRTDIEGASLQSEEGEAGSGFVGSKGERDTSSELIDEQDFSKNGQGAPEGK